ncbi:MAG: Fur family transcriptional regulator [Pseudomonadota bacterium]
MNGTVNPHEHDHEACVETALANAEAICKGKGLRLTAMRRQVLELVWSSHEPVGAYELLDALGRDGKRSAPPTVYRALEFLRDAGLVHRLDSLNAFVGCASPGEAHHGQFLICRQCNQVIEIDAQAISAAVADSALACGFVAERQTLEVQGICAQCQ